PPRGEVLTDSSTVVYSNITQIVDHIGNITGTWTQRYQYNPKFYNATAGIVFLMIGGEGSISPPGDKWVRDESIMMMQWAKKHGAAAFQLEHRFYGPSGYAPLNSQVISQECMEHIKKSATVCVTAIALSCCHNRVDTVADTETGNVLTRPGRAAEGEPRSRLPKPGVASSSQTSKQDTEALKLLTIDQALEDIKEFMKQMNEKYFKGTNTKWVTFGGSYPGSLSAFFRETYPDLTIGAVSTSSAVNVFVDYYGTSPCSFLRYLQNAEENYRAQNVSCAASIATAFRSMQTNFYNGAGGRQLLKNIFSCQEGSNGKCTVTGKGGSNCTSTNGVPPSQERNVALRRPLLEVPNFSGDLRELNAFWSVFETLIYNDASLTDQEKFLFLKQALKAAASITYVPVIGEKYCVAVNILKKQYDRSAMMADILISEIEKIPRAHDTPKSCRDTLSAITSRIIHLEQTGVSIKSDRVWRRLILSKFTEYICGRVIRKESKTGIPL
ncbi:unnamed protein product, partial [Heligmosomoides polygyrus]